MMFAKDMERWVRENQTTAALGAVAFAATMFWFYTRRAKIPGKVAAVGAMPIDALSPDFRTGIQSTSIPYDARNYYTDFSGSSVSGDWW